MKKLYFIALSFFAGLTLTNAQVVLTQTNHAPTAGDMYEMYQIDSTGISPGASGTSAVWNFTATPTRTTIMVTNSCSASTNTMYPVGSVARATGTSSANYYTSTGTALNFWGGHVQVSVVNADYVFNTPATHAVYAMIYNTSAISSFTGAITSGTNNGTISNGTSTVIADGQGTLNLPNRSFANVLRVNTYTGFDFNLPLSFPFPPATGDIKQQTWDYYTSLTEFPSSKINPLYSIIASTITVTSPTNIVQTSTVVMLNRDYEYVGITENSSEVTELNLFPNPANSHFNLIFVNEKAEQVSVEITNALGQNVKKVSLENTKGVVNHNVDITNIEAGVYFVKVNVGSRSSIKKLTIQ
jgi:hypothetical protein